MRTLMSQIRDERGVTMIVVMGTLLTLGILSTVLATQAFTHSNSSNKDRRSKRALEAASAGVHIARYRLNTSTPLATNCMVSSPTGPWEVTPSGGACPTPTPESIGNGGTYSYVMGPVLAAGSVCGATTSTPPAARCLTSVGIINGEYRRIQTTVVRQMGAKVFKVAGVIGLNSVTLANATNVNTTVGSNTLVSLVNGATVQGQAALPVSGTLNVQQGGVLTGGRLTIDTPFELDQPDFSAVAADNDNASLPAGMYNAGTKALTVPAGITVLPAGQYHVCSVSASAAAQLRLAAGTAAEIYVDSPSRAGSGCPAGSGGVTFGNNSVTNQIAGAADKLDLFVHGPGNVTFQQQSRFYGSVYAPQSTVLLRNASAVVGAIAANNVDFENAGTLTFPAALASKVYPIPGIYGVSGWTECRPRPPNPADISASC